MIIAEMIIGLFFGRERKKTLPVLSPFYSPGSQPIDKPKNIPWSMNIEKERKKHGLHARQSHHEQHIIIIMLLLPRSTRSDNFSVETDEKIIDSFLLWPEIEFLGKSTS